MGMIRSAFVRGHLPWLLVLAAVGLATRLPHLAALANPSHETEVTYFPTIASARFEQCALEMNSGGVESDAFSYASPLYIPFLALFYALSAGNLAVFLVQSALGILSGFLVYIIGSKAGASRPAACLCALVWLMYAPAAFLETTLLPVALLPFLVCLWALLEPGGGTGWRTALLAGLLVGLIAGLRPPFVLLGAASIAAMPKRRCAVPFLAGLLLPLLALSLWHYAQAGRFSPFASSTGLNLVLGHADGASGYGPPIVEHGLVESSGEDIHQAAARVASEHGYATPASADRFWLRTAVDWMLANPRRELELLGVKLGGALGYRPYDVYFDLQRDVASDLSLRHLIAPRVLLVAIMVLGATSFIVFRSGRRRLIAPVLVSLLSSVVFVHSERFWIPAIPVTLAAASAGLCSLWRAMREARRRQAAVVAVAFIAIMLPGMLWPVPDVAEGFYLYNRAVKTFHLGNSPLALILFEEAAEVSPYGTITSIQARMMAARLSLALGMEDRAREHALVLEREMDRSGQP